MIDESTFKRELYLIPKRYLGCCALLIISLLCQFIWQSVFYFSVSLLCLSQQTLTEGALSPVHPHGFNETVQHFRLHVGSNLWGLCSCYVGSFLNVFQDGLQNRLKKTPTLQMPIKMWDRNLWLKWKQKTSSNSFGKPCVSWFLNNTISHKSQKW